jgi:hypothetical protein
VRQTVVQQAAGVLRVVRMEEDRARAVTGCVGSGSGAVCWCGALWALLRLLACCGLMMSRAQQARPIAGLVRQLPGKAWQLCPLVQAPQLAQTAAGSKQ